MKTKPPETLLTKADQLVNFRLVFQAVLVIAVFVLLKDILLRGILHLFTGGPYGLLGRLPESACASWGLQGSPYEEWSIFAGSMRSPVFLLFFLLFTAASFAHPGRLQWKTYGRIAQVITFTAVGIMAWSYSTHGYNLYVDQAHVPDRLLVLALALGVALHPGFIAPYSCVLLLSMSQFLYPIDSYSLTDKQMPLNAIILFAAFHLTCVLKVSIDRMAARLRSKRRSSDDQSLRRKAYLLSRPRWLMCRLNGGLFLFVLLCMIGACYFVPAMSKIQISPSGIEWLTNNDLSRHVAGSTLRENHFFFSRGGSDAAASLAGEYGGLLAFGTLALEFSAILLLLNRRVSSALLFLFALLHVGICGLSGIFFWKWVILDGVLAILVLTRGARAIYTKRGFLLSVVLMLTASMHFRPIKLAWFDTALLGSYRVTILTEGGQELDLVKTSARPFEMLFVFERFDFINTEKMHEGMNVTVHYDIAKRINGAGAEGAMDILEREGVVEFDEEAAKVFDEFIVRYFQNWNRRQDHGIPPFDAVPPPNHILSGPSKNIFRWDQRVTQVDFHFRTAYFDGETTHSLKEVPIRRVVIPPASRDE